MRIREFIAKQQASFIFFLAAALIPVLGFFHPGLPLTHDGQDHVARMANFYQSLSEGNLIPRWAANLNWGYGHPILMFLYPLPSYLASIFRAVGFSPVDATKTVFVLSFVFSGVFMYLWIREMWGREAGLVGGLFYLFAPYRFVDLYVRGAIGECWAFVWPPLILYFALKMSRKPRFGYLAGGSLALAALILSHNAISLMFLPVIFGYMGYLVFISKKKFLCSMCYVLCAVLGFMLSAFFWLPALAEGKYTLRDIVTEGNITGFESLSRLLWSPWNYGGTGTFSVQLGILQWLAVVLAPLLIWLFWRKKDKNWLFLAGLLICFCLAIFLILPAAKPLYFGLPLLSKFQFAWRWLSLAVFPPAVFAAAMVFIFPKRLKFLCAMFFVLCSILLNKDFWYAKDYLDHPESFYTQAYPGTTDTGESAPRWSVRFMEHFPTARAELIEGEAEIQSVSRSATKEIFTVKARVPSRLVVNTLYFPGWQVLVSAQDGPASGRDGRPAEIQFQDPAWRGLMTFGLPEGEHQITVVFRETKLRLAANGISGAGLIILLFGGIISQRSWKNRKSRSL